MKESVALGRHCSFFDGVYGQGSYKGNETGIIYVIIELTMQILLLRKPFSPYRNRTVHFSRLFTQLVLHVSHPAETELYSISSSPTRTAYILQSVGV